MFHDIVKKYLENSKTFKISNIGFNKRKYISYFHGRELCFKNNNKWLSIKGTGWNYGPPYIFTAEYDFNCLGLMNYTNALREKKISDTLKKKFPDKFSTSLEIIKFENTDLIKIKNLLPKNFLPAILIREVSSPYRLKDLFLKSKSSALKNFRDYFGENTYLSLTKLQNKVLHTILNYHLHGYLHDMLDLGNVNTHGQILDLEYFYIPKAKYPKYFKISKRILRNRKEKEAIYFLEIMYQISELFNKKTSLRDLSKKSLQMIKNKGKFKNLIFYKTLKKISLSK